MLAGMLPLLKMIFGFGLVVFIHEFGHYLMARRNGVFVEKFAIGFDFFGAKLFSWRRGGTEYVVGAFPVGGYVKMLGQNELPSEIEAHAHDPGSFTSKTVWQRVQIISAGVIANFLSAALLAYAATVLGYHVTPPEVGSVGYHSLQAGLRPGDTLVEVGGRRIGNWQELFVAYATQEPGRLVEFVVERDGEQLRLAVPVQRDEDDPFNVPDFARPVEARVSSVVVESRADEAGVKPGDRLLEVDGEPIRSWSHFSDLMRRRGEVDATLKVRRDARGGPGEEVVLDIRPESRRPVFLPEKTLGVEPADGARVDYVAPGSPAEAAGLKPGDRVTRVAGTPVGSWYGLWREVSWKLPEGRPVELEVQRAGEDARRVSVAQVPAASWGTGVYGLSTLGIAGEPPETVVFGSPEPGSPAAEAGIAAGDTLLRMTVPTKAAPPRGLRGFWLGLTGQEAPTVEPTVVSGPSWEAVLYGLGSLEEDWIELELERGGRERIVRLTPRPDDEDFAVGFFGVGPKAHEVLVQKGPAEAIGPSLVAPFRILEEFLVGLQAMFIGRISASTISGPVGILGATYRFAEKSTGDLFLFLALLSVNLAVVNFLPIPITDGGHFMFLMYEHFKGRRMDEELEARFQWAGLVFILLLFLFATFNDVGRVLGL